MLKEYLKELSKVKLLRPQEEKELWRKYKEEDDLSARQKLIEAYQPLTFKLVMKMQSKEDLTLDLVQEATVGLIEAVERYDPNRGINFPSYASFRIRGQMINFLQKVSTELISLDQTYGSEEESPTLLEQIPEDKIPTEDATINHIYWEEPLKKALSKLPEKERKIIESVLMEDQNPQEVAKDLGISLPHLYRLQKKGLRRVKGMLSWLRHEAKDDKI
jgi:RNA polymerase sporulation-specific sigma factor